VRLSGMDVKASFLGTIGYYLTVTTICRL
jgi:hypothetical protein